MGKHPICHIELAAKDQAQSARFYSDLFGWQTQHIPEMSYTTFAATGGPGGGFLKIGEHEVKEGDIHVFVATDNIGATLKRAESLGGKTLTGESEIPHVGWFAVLADPAGTTMCLFKPKGEYRPSEGGKAKHPICHIEIPAKDGAESGTFYGALFGWQIHTAPEFNYTMFSAEGGPGGGFITIGEHGVKPNDFHVYVLTDDIDATLKRAESLGGKTLTGKSEIPGTGWMAGLLDPAGTQCWLYTPMAQSGAAAAD